MRYKYIESKNVNNHDVGFLGLGNKVNGYFALKLDQSGLQTALNNIPILRNTINDRLNEMKKEVSNYLWPMINLWGIEGQYANQIISTLSETLGELLFEDVIGNNNIESPILKDIN